MEKCEDLQCDTCYPDWQEQAAQRVEDDRQDCETCWRFYQRKAEAIVGNGDPIAINRRINAAYAQLWIDDRRFQWAGLAAFASKQVGCGLLNAAEIMQKSNQQRDRYQSWGKQSFPLERLSPFASPRMPMVDQGAGDASDVAYRMLAKGNMALFLDIWPLHMFYKAFGLGRFKHCLEKREKLNGSVLWPIAREVKFGFPWPEVTQGFEAIDAGNIVRGLERLAWHEQNNILQPALYDDRYFAILMRANHFSWVVSFPSGTAKEIQLTLASECSVEGRSARKETFSNQPLANLADPVQRMKFVMRAADRFNTLLQDPQEGLFVENSLYVIAGRG
ncbi:hypothetical protein [Glaciimonas sp. PAMC28666]|uniref:DUF2515 family protein n=1 Tax=Glaciimonas sp. PAMC28666 TaxID=2807626 RepID=UPI00196351BE|nr:hypothetical protein [Glaciimonas sp. PAMC28666]QRX83107.1 hypothetical protein JQN73_02110 [Glaciimonas sp. PAMC28666]